MKFKIKYKRIKYKVGIKDKISITMIKIIICIKRNLRRIKMLIPENNMVISYSHNNMGAFWDN